MIFHAVRDTYTPVAVYKALVKMALSLIPYEKMPYFIDTVTWLKEDSHLISKFDFNNYEFMIERYIPGPKPFELRASGFVRKSDIYAVPYFQFLLEFSNYSYQIIVPCTVKDSILETLGEVEFVQIPGSDEVLPIKSPFGEPTIQLKDMRGKNKVKNENIDLCMSFEKCDKHEGNGKSIDDVLNEEGIELKKRLKK